MARLGVAEHSHRPLYFSSVFKELKLLDYGSLFLAATLTLAGIVIGLDTARGRSMLIVHSAEGKSVYPLATDRTIELKGPIGTTVVEVRDGRVRVARDPGPLQICVREGWIERPGEFLICLPNRVLLTIEQASAEEYGVDAGSF